MEVSMARKVAVFDQSIGQKNVICTYWLAGRCNKNPCRFLHCEQKSGQPKSKQSGKVPPRKMTWKNPKLHSHKTVESNETYTNGTISKKRSSREVMDDAIKKGSVHHEPAIAKSEKSGFEKNQLAQCEYWVMGNCVRGDRCKYVHSWFSGSGFTMLAKLEDHTKGISGISLPFGCDKLYSCAKDRSIRAWNCHSGQCAGTLTTDEETGCLLSEGQWVLVGLQNRVQAWNIQKQFEFSLDAPSGLVHSLASDDANKLFAGLEDGTILIWIWHPETTDIPEPVAMLKEHTSAVCSLAVGSGNRLYSGSKDCTIKVWDRESFQCLHTLRGHARDVMSVLCWDSYLISASLDNTIKVWALNENETIEVVYERKEDSAVIALCGIADGENKPILLCSCDDKTVRLYDLPSFTERSRIFSRGRVEVIQTGIEGLFFTGDATGQIGVWQLIGLPNPAAA
ncbi:Zinc finger CCCH domain-containing protein 63 [Striga hermonthica]|uniref:Zinc finger CCCH domain-containing protein 63 n=1 Tax=Striga hermonthica TaxID=68872 RepID=A0A9N7P1K9_STRHE|nr:Zinc finger CCCH domain-containing protein 63 [Striga hermonthica]